MAMLIPATGPITDLTPTHGRYFSHAELEALLGGPLWYSQKRREVDFGGGKRSGLIEPYGEVYVHIQLTYRDRLPLNRRLLNAGHVFCGPVIIADPAQIETTDLIQYSDRQWYHGYPWYDPEWWCNKLE